MLSRVQGKPLAESWQGERATIEPQTLLFERN